MAIHFRDRDGRYMCNKAVCCKESKMVIDKKKVTCKNCIKRLDIRNWGKSKNEKQII